jgi:ribosomal-protein-alanine N-acetyltransferase
MQNRTEVSKNISKFQKKIAFEIQNLNPLHISQVKQIESECGLSPWTEEDYRIEILRENSIALAAFDGDFLAGFVIARLIMFETDKLQVRDIKGYPNESLPSEAEIYNIAVKRELQNIGIGQALLDCFILRARKKFVSKIWLEVRASNHTAIEFYRKNKFVEVYQRKNFYNAPIEDGIVMSLELLYGK